ncbi:MAG: hydantoinase/oxoprolinase N-terminal domain-containing protein, partial [Myxococcota bacterium]
MTWEFAIDRGGTFTDCIGVAPDGSVHVAKRLSVDDAAADAMRALLVRAGVITAEQALPACRVRMGTTVATNALLERRGVRTLLVANAGLGDVLAIGTQERPDLFALRIDKPRPLHDRVIEVSGRVAADGAVVTPLDEDAAAAALAEARRAGFDGRLDPAPFEYPFRVDVPVDLVELPEIHAVGLEPPQTVFQVLLGP